MAESPRGALVGHLLTGTFRFSDRSQTDDQIDHGEYGHRDIQHYVDIVYLFAGETLTYDSAYQHRRQSARERVQRTADHIQLVASVAAATEQVQHRVHNGVQHTYAKTAKQRTAQIYSETVKHTAHPLYGDTDKTKENSGQSRLFIAVFSQIITRRNTHDQVRKEVEEVSQHTHTLCLSRVVERSTPDLAYRSG